MAKNVYPLSQIANEMNSIVSQMISEYGEQCQQTVEKVTKEIAEDFAKDLAKVTPRSDSLVSEHTADTVKVSEKKQKFYGRSSKSFVVHYRKWQLSHLLEFGWTAKNGKKIVRQPFVRPLFDKNKEKYIQRYKDTLE